MENQLLRDAARTTGLKIVKINTKEELLDLLDSGLNQLYADVFGGEPYNEVFTSQEVNDIFLDYFEKAGRIFIGLCPETNNPVSFVVSTPLTSKFDIVALLDSDKNPNDRAYFAEDGVSDEFRRKGISSAMKNLLLLDCSLNGFSEVILRTSMKNIPQRNAVEKAGGLLIEGVTQNIERVQRDVVVNEDNCFYVFSL